MATETRPARHARPRPALADAAAPPPPRRAVRRRRDAESRLSGAPRRHHPQIPLQQSYPLCRAHAHPHPRGGAGLRAHDRLGRRAAPVAAQRAGKVGGEPLTGSQVEVLRLVETQPGVGVRDAAAALHLAPNTVSTLVGGLVAAGLLDRRPDPDDRRATQLHLTPAATTRLRRWRDERDRVLAHALGHLDAEDRGRLEASLPALERLLAALERDR